MSVIVFAISNVSTFSPERNLLAIIVVSLIALGFSNLVGL